MPHGNIRHGHACIRTKGRISPEYNAWRCMIQRCTNPLLREYHRYGGCGITICDRWRHSFENFLADMGQKPSPQHSLDRFPNPHGNYEPGNCRWATDQEQMQNRRDQRLVTLGEETLCLAEWARRTGISTGTLRDRLDSGWTHEATLLTPPAANGRVTSLTFQGQTKTVAAWARETGIKDVTIRARLRRGYSAEKALAKREQQVQPRELHGRPQ